MYDFTVDCKHLWCFPGGTSGKEPTYQCRRHKRCGFDPWVPKIPWSRKLQPTPVFLPGESHGLRSLGVQSIGWQRFRHDWSDLAHTHTHTHNCFTMLCWFLLHNNVNPLYVYIYSSLLNLPHTPPSQPPRSGHQTEHLWTSWRYTAASH